MTHRKGEEGFTMIEVLTASILTGTALFMLGSFLFSASSLTVRSAEALRSSANMLGADEIIRRRAAMVCIPYWEQDLEIIQRDGYTEIPWYGGKRDWALRLTPEGDSLIIQCLGPGLAGEKELLPLGKSLNISDITILRDRKGLPYGLDIAYTHPGGRNHTAAAFASLPLNRRNP